MPSISTLDSSDALAEILPRLRRLNRKNRKKAAEATANIPTATPTPIPTLVPSVKPVEDDGFSDVVDVESPVVNSDAV